MSCLAAPTSDTPAALEPNATNALPGGLSTGARALDRNSDTRTIDMLVEMQQPTAGIQFNERASRNSGREGAPRAAPPQPPPPPQPALRPELEAPPPSGLFGSGATPAVQARSQNVVDRPSSRDDMPARASGRPSADVPPEMKLWLHWPREVVEYVRENRGFVVGCAATLLLVAWMGSVLFSRRRG